MNRYRYIIISIFSCMLLGAGIAYNVWNMPHLDVQAAHVFEQLNVSDFIRFALKDKKAFNQKYLESNGESKVIIISGKLQSVDYTKKGNPVLYLSDDHQPVLIQCILLNHEQVDTAALTGKYLKIKGIVRSGAEYDEDLDMYEDAILEKCRIIKD